MAIDISSICGSPLTNDLGIYLGMPILHSRVGKHTYSRLIDKAQSRLASWKSKTLNIAGRLTLIKSVTSAIPIYSMQTTKLPINTCDKLDSINRAFLWGDTAEQKKVHLVNWETVCRPKLLGGLGIKRTRDMNQAMLAKASWRILQDDKGLWCKIFRKKYLVNSTFPQGYSKPAACSNTWSSIVNGTSLLKKGLKWRIGNGATVKFWVDIWTKFGILSDHTSRNSPINLNNLVCDFWMDNCWDISKLSQHLPPIIVDHICAIPISCAAVEDKLIWGATANGQFSVNSAYLLNFADQPIQSYPWSKNWKLPVLPKVKVFLWIFVARKLLTNTQRMVRKFTTDPSCFHCPGCPETLLHLFRNCPKAIMVWNSFYIPPVMAASFSLNWNGWIHANLLQQNCLIMNISWNVFFTFVCWHIWKWRCKCVFDSRFNLPFDMRNIILSYIEEWSSASKNMQKVCDKQIIMLQWKKPNEGVMKINVDGSMKKDGSIGAGGVIRDYSGAWCGGFMINLGTGDIMQAEAWGIYYGLQLALRYNQLIVEIESDSTTMLNLLLMDDVSVHPLGTVINNCKLLSSSLHSCSFKHIHREKNIVADLLAKASFENEKGIIWLDDAPPVVVDAVQDDIAGVSIMRQVAVDVPRIPSCFGAFPSVQANAEDTINLCSLAQVGVIGVACNQVAHVTPTPRQQDAIASPDMLRQNVVGLYSLPTSNYHDDATCPDDECNMDNADSGAVAGLPRQHGAVPADTPHNQNTSWPCGMPTSNAQDDPSNADDNTCNLHNAAADPNPTMHFLSDAVD